MKWHEQPRCAQPWVYTVRAGTLHITHMLSTGGESDWAIVSDADEIAAPSVLAWLRQLDPRQHNGTIRHLLPYHRFKYGVHCQATMPSPQLRPPHSPLASLP